MLPGIKAKTILLCTLLSHSLGYHVKSKKLIKKKNGMDKQQGLTVYYREQQSISCDKPQ